MICPYCGAEVQLEIVKSGEAYELDDEPFCLSQPDDETTFFDATGRMYRGKKTENYIEG